MPTLTCADVDACAVPAWWDRFARHTLPAARRRLSEAEVAYLHSDGVLLPGPPPARAARGDDDSDSDSDAWDNEAPDADAPTVQPIPYCQGQPHSQPAHGWVRVRALHRSLCPSWRRG
jgi:hypothetical protein